MHNYVYFLICDDNILLSVGNGVFLKVFRNRRVETVYVENNKSVVRFVADIFKPFYN